jgi:hypothetical protein
LRRFQAKALGGLRNLRRRLSGPGAMNSQGSDSPAVHGHDFHLPTRDLYAIAHPRQASELGERVPAKCRPVSFGNLNSVIRTDIY